MHDIYNEDGEVAKGGTSRSQVGEGLVAWSVNNLEAGNLEVEVQTALHALHMLLNSTLREISGTNLLSDTTCLASLDISASELVED